MKRTAAYRLARAKFRELPKKIGADSGLTRALARQWREASAKDPSGMQCVRLVDDIIERNTPLKW